MQQHSVPMRRMSRRTSPMAAAATAAALLVLLVAAGSGGAAQEEEEPEVLMRSTPLCAKYHPKDCWYKPTDPERPPAIPWCIKGHECNFDLKQRLQCPYWTSGTYSVGESKTVCSTKFMEEVARPRPTCDNSCCTSDPGPGRWIDDLQSPGHKVFAPDEGCSYFQYGRREVLEYFQNEATDILVVGDSFMRQLFVRFMHLMRGQERVVDYKVHTHATYAVCDAADNFAAAPAYNEKLSASKDKQFYSTNTFFLNEHNLTTHERWADCKMAPFQAHYMFGSTFRQQIRNLERYSKDGYRPDARVDVIISVMFWTHEWEPPQEWLDALTALKAQKFVRRVFMLGIPTARVDPKSKGYAEAYQNRNRVMREWAANHTRDAYYIDFDVISTAPGIPAACAEFNKHYACHLRSQYTDDLGDANFLREPHLNVPLGGFFSSEDGQCYDDVNAQIWSMYFNVAMKEGSAQGERQQGAAPARKRSRRRTGASAGSSWASTLGAYTDRFIDRLWMRGIP